MRIQCVTYMMGQEECKLLIRLLKEHQRDIETRHHNGIGIQADTATLMDYHLSVDMYNDLLHQYQTIYD